MIILIPIMAFLSRCCGASWARFPAEWVFAAPFGWAAYEHTGVWWVGLLAWNISYIGMQFGHGNFYQMRGVDLTNDKPEQIEWFARSIYPNIYTPAYSWICMGLKGLVIGLTAFPYGLALGLLWPLSYYLSFKYTKSSVLAEYLSGGFAGLILWASL